MVKLNKIYTRTGDDGTTGLVDGSRIAKSAPLMAAVGDVDETNSAVGLAAAALPADSAEAAMLARIQNELFDLGADLATPARADDPTDSALRILDSQVERLEQEIDQLNETLPPLASFILPGGAPAAAALHLARTVCRRAERVLVATVEAGEAISPPAMRYVNRLSDFLFVAARHANDRGASEVFWASGATR
jgi:cob(I)alamin adenosyltransferase